MSAARDSTNPHDFALVAMLALLGLRIFEACGASINDLGEEHGHRVLRVRGKGGKVVLFPLPPAVARTIDRAVDGRDNGPILRNSLGARMDRHAATRRLKHLAASAGRVVFAGREITRQPAHGHVATGLVMVPEGRNVFGALTIEENLKVGAGMRPDRHKIAADLDAVYREFPMLADRRHAVAGMLSGGQQQMLVIGRALMTSPRLIAIDEPSLGLAPKIIDQVYEILMRLRAQRKLTLLIVEQSSTRAMMTGRLRLSDMALAMKLQPKIQSLFSKAT